MTETNKFFTKTCLKCGDSFYTLHENYDFCALCFYEQDELYHSPEETEKRKAENKKKSKKFNQTKKAVSKRIAMLFVKQCSICGKWFKASKFEHTLCSTCFRLNKLLEAQKNDVLLDELDRRSDRLTSAYQADSLVQK